MQTPNKPKQTRPKFDKEFKAEASKMIAEEQSVAALARSLNVSQKLIHRWKHEQKKQIGQRKATSWHGLQQLKNQLKRVEIERDILKKSTAPAARSSSLASRLDTYVRVY
ncbi:transposase [Spirosoma arcticum]